MAAAAEAENEESQCVLWVEAHNKRPLRRLLVYATVDLLGVHISRTIIQFDTKFTVARCLGKRNPTRTR